MIVDAQARILVIQTAFLGDVVLTTPLFRALKRLYPESRVAAMVTPQAAPLVEEDPHLEQLLTYDKQGGESMAAALRKIRNGRFDLLIAAHRSHRTALLALLSGVPARVGFREAGFSWVYTSRVHRPAEAHEVDRNLALLKGVGGHPAAADRELYVGYTAREESEVQRLLVEEGIGSERSVVGLCPGSVWATKRWSPEGFAAVGKALRKEGYGIALLGGPDDVQLAAEVARSIGEGTVTAAGRTSLKALAAWMDRVTLLVTNDSAPLHVAAARGTPTVAVFGATTQTQGFAPFHEKSAVVEVDLECRPCGPHGGKSCVEGHFRCMGDIDPGAVLREARRLLTDGRGSN